MKREYGVDVVWDIEAVDLGKDLHSFEKERQRETQTDRQRDTQIDRACVPEADRLSARQAARR